jgi:hypothetical protein
VTPKWLTIRLRQLEAGGIVNRDHEPGRREVWHELTEKGRDLAPVLEALVAWGLKYEREPLDADEAAHPEHLAAGLTVALNAVAAKPARRRTWRLEFAHPDGRSPWCSTASDGRSPTPLERPTSSLLRLHAHGAEFVTRPLASRRLPSGEIPLSGAPGTIAELVEVLGAAPATR